jgi:hypothetical protein
MSQTTQEQMADEQQRQLDNKLLGLIQQYFPSIPLHGEDADKNWTRWLNFARECSKLSTPPTEEGQGQVGDVPVYCVPVEHEGRIVYDHSDKPIPMADNFILYSAPPSDVPAEPSVVPMPEPALRMNSYPGGHRVTDNYYSADQIEAYADARVAEAVSGLLGHEHKGMRVDYRGMFKQSIRGLRDTPGMAFMLSEIEKHLTEAGSRFYAGDLKVVDEFFQLYCVAQDERRALIAKYAPKKEQDNG